MIKSRKASIDVQFNWIFVLVIGALIILFFINVMKSSEKTATQTTYQSVGTSLKNLISQIESDDKNSRTIKLPNIVINLNCEELEVEKSNSYENIKYKTFFSPNKIKGNNLLGYTANFNMPYPVDNFIFMTSNQVRYNFVNNSCITPSCKAMLKEIIKLLPVNSTYQIKSDSILVTENNNYKERFIFFNTDPTTQSIHNSLKDLPNEDITAINIIGDMKSGNVTYYTKNKVTLKFESPSLAYPYFGVQTSENSGASMLVGAVLSDEDIYDCNKNKALVKYKIMTTIYSNRTKIFKDAYSLYDLTSPEYNCYEIYNSVGISNILTKLNSPPIDFPGIASIAANVETANKESILESCPSIY